MKDKGPVIILLLVAVGLGIALIVVNKEASDQKKEAADQLAVASNTVTSVKKQLDELQAVNQTLETNLLSARADFSNKLALTEASLHTAEANLDKAATEAKAQVDSNAVALAQRDQKISELETENQALDKEASSLRVSMTNLDTRIAATQAKLAKSEGDREFLLRQLKILKAEKAQMEQQFNSLATVREQLRKLKSEASIDRRLERQRRQIDATFAANAGGNPTEPTIVAPPPDGSGASVELRQRGGVKIEIPPSTNAPPK